MEKAYISWSVKEEMFHLFCFRFSSSSSFKTKSIESFLRAHFHMAFERKIPCSMFQVLQNVEIQLLEY